MGRNYKYRQITGDELERLLKMYSSPLVEIDSIVECFNLPEHRIRRIAHDNGVQRFPVGFRRIIKSRVDVDEVVG